MAAARKPCNFDFNVSNNSKSLPTQAQSPRIALPSKSFRGVGKQEYITLGYDPVGAPEEQLDQPSHDDCFPLDWSRPESTLMKRLARRTGLNRTGEEKSDQERHNYVNKLRDGKGASSLNLPQSNSTRFWGIGRPSRDFSAPKSPCFEISSSPRMGHDTRSQWTHDGNHGGLAGRHELPSDWWSVDLGYENVIAKTPSTISHPPWLVEMVSDIVDKVFLELKIKRILLDEVFLELKIELILLRQLVFLQPKNDQDSGKEHREKWSQIVRFCCNEAASKGILARRVNNQIETLFFLKKPSSQGPCGSASRAEIRESHLLDHSVGEETIAPKELDLFGRDWIHRWKDGAGRKKDWRSSRYLKCLRKGERAKCQLSPSGRRSPLRYLYRSKPTSHQLAITPSPPHIAVPKDMLRQKSTSFQGHSSCLKPRSPWQATKHIGFNKKTSSLPKFRDRYEQWMTDARDSLDSEEESDFSYTEVYDPLDQLLAPESFVDTILGAWLRLKRHLRTEPHYEVYDAESLSDKTQKYEVRAYTLRGLSLKIRNSRIRNLKRASARSSYIDSLEQRGKKWVVFAAVEADPVPEPFQDYHPLWCTKEEYNRAFPAIQPRRAYNSENTEKIALEDKVVDEAYDDSSKKALEAAVSKGLDAYQTFKRNVMLRELLLAAFKSFDEGEDTTMPEKRKKPKSPEQAKRLRDRQRLSRQTKRMAKAAQKLGATTDSMSQTLDMTSEPPTQSSLGNENNHVAAAKTIAIQVQEDHEGLVLCDVCRMTPHGPGTTLGIYPILFGYACLRELGGQSPCLRELVGA